MNDLYLKSGMYTCNVCKKWFNSHTRMFLGKDKGYGCPYCRRTDFTEEEMDKKKPELHFIGWTPIYLKWPYSEGAYDVTIETPDGMRLLNVGYFDGDKTWTLLIDKHNYQDCHVIAWGLRPEPWRFKEEDPTMLEVWEQIKNGSKSVRSFERG